MRLQSLIRSIAISAIVMASLIFGSDKFSPALAQTATTATPRSTSAPIAGVTVTYTVQSGDSFNAIARRFNLTPPELQALNNITDTSVIRAGQVLIVAVSTLTPEPAATFAPAATATVAPPDTPTIEPTIAPTDTPTPAPTSAPTATFALLPTEQPALSTNTGIPPDVIVVGVVMLLAIIGIIIGFRTQRY